jgi:hypothetical protein
MEHKIVSFYHSNLPLEIVNLQKKVFNKLSIPLIQTEFNFTHGSGIKEYLDNNEWDKITLFDVDCIPLNKNCIEYAKNIVNDDIIYGNAQISNSTPYAAPSFITFTRNLYETSPHKYFEGAMYPKSNGEYVEADCTEVFVKENVKRGKKLILSYPISCLYPEWKYVGEEEYPSFEYGNGTTFDNKTYHSFQIRLKEKQDIFINYVKKFLNED